MALNIAKELATLRRMTVGELQEKYAEVFHESTNGRHKQWLIKRIAWRMQANAEGDLSDRARRRAAELANDADLRVMPPKNQPSTLTTEPDNVPEWDDRLPGPGTMLTRQYKGRNLQVLVRADGFEFEGELYKSLSAIATAATGSRWNGFHFFGLGKKEVAR
jgi:hypothetical protein